MARRHTGHAILTAIIVCLAAAPAVGGCVRVTASGNFTPAHKGKLTVATGEVPLEGFWEGTARHPTGGFEYELAVAIAKQLGLHHVAIVVVPFSQIVQGDLGGADIALSDITATGDREQVLDFSDPYLSARPSVLVRAGTSVSDLKTARGLTWTVGRSSTLLGFLNDTIQPDTPSLLSSSLGQSVDAVRNGKVDAALLDLPVAAAVARDSGGALTVAGQFDSNDDISAAVVQGSPNLDAVQSAVRALIADGTIASLADRWLGLDINGTQADQVPLIRTED